MHHSVEGMAEMIITNPRRILFLAPPDSGILALLNDLTGSAPSPRIVPLVEYAHATNETSASQEDQQSRTAPEAAQDPGEADPVKTIATTAGLSHSLSIRNKYYKADIPVWIDETSKPDEWKQDFVSSDARGVVRAIGAFVLCFRINQTITELDSVSAKGNAEDQSSVTWVKSMMGAVRAAIESAYGSLDMWDGVFLCVGLPGYTAGWSTADGSMPTAADSSWEELCWDFGFEYVNAGHSTDRKLSSSGESGGIKRILEALETNEWEWDVEESEDDEDEDENEFDNLVETMTAKYLSKGDLASFNTAEDAGFARERQELEQEMLDLKLSLHGASAEEEDEDEDENDEESQVEGLEQTMGKVLAVKDMTSHMPESERKKFAARAVRDIMKTI